MAHEELLARRGVGQAREELGVLDLFERPHAGAVTPCFTTRTAGPRPSRSHATSSARP